MDTRKRRKEGGVVAPTLDSFQESPKRARVHAQRKFAQGSQPNSPAPTPVKETRELRERSGSTETRTRSSTQAAHPPPPPPLDLVEVPVRPTVEDFLTFLCYRGTALLPPGLEHFNTPQLVEAGDSRSQSPARDDKTKPTSKKKQDGVSRELSKDSVKKNLDQSTEEMDAPVFRVTRNSPHPQMAITDPTTSLHPATRKLSKRLMVNKALLLQTKAHMQDGKGLGLRHRDGSVGDIKRSNRLLQKYRISATTAMARKKARVAMLSSLRPKQKLSRILKRLGATTAMHQDSKQTRITRSQVEVKEEADRSAEAEDKGEPEDSIEPKMGSCDEEESATPHTRPVRLVRQKVMGKKVVVKKIVRVTREATRKLDISGSSSCESVSTSPSQSTPSQSPEQVPLAKRLRSGTQDPVTPPMQKKLSPSVSPQTPSPQKRHTVSDQEAQKPAVLVTRSGAKTEQKVVSGVSELETSVDKSSNLLHTKISSLPTVSLSLQKLQPCALHQTQISSLNHGRKTNMQAGTASSSSSKFSLASPPSPIYKKYGNAREDKSREDKSSKEKDDTYIVSPASASSGNEEPEKPVVKTRPSRRTKEAATAYLQLIGRKLAEECRSGRTDDDEDDDDYFDDLDVEAFTVGCAHFKSQAKTKDREAELESKRSKDTPSSSPSKYSPHETTSSDAASKVTVRKSQRKTRDTPGVEATKTTSPDVSPMESSRVTRRNQVKDEIGEHTCGLRAKRTPQAKDEISSLEHTCGLRPKRSPQVKDDVINVGEYTSGIRAKRAPQAKDDMISGLEHTCGLRTKRTSQVKDDVKDEVICSEDELTTPQEQGELRLRARRTQYKDDVVGEHTCGLRARRTLPVKDEEMSSDEEHLISVVRARRTPQAKDEEISVLEHTCGLRTKRTPQSKDDAMSYSEEHTPRLRRTPQGKDEEEHTSGVRRSKRSDKRDSGVVELKPVISPLQDSSKPSKSDTTTSNLRCFRRTRSDAEEVVKKASQHTRRSSLETDNLSDSPRKRLTRGSREGYETEENRLRGRGEAHEIEENEESETFNVRAKREKRRTSNGDLVIPTKLDDSEKRVRTRRYISESSNCSTNESPEIIKNSEIDCENTLTRREQELKLKECNITMNKVEMEKEEIVTEKETDFEMDEAEKLSGPGGKSRRTVTQERKVNQNRNESSRSLRKSIEKCDGDTCEINTRSSRSKCGAGGIESTDSSTSIDVSSEKKPAPISQGKRKSIGGRRRSSNHDEAKLNEVLESVAKVFEKDIDGDHYEKIENDFMLVNKSPEKNKDDEKVAEVSEGRESNVADSNSNLDDKSSNLADTVGCSTGTSGGRSAVASMGQTGNTGSPSPNRRSNTSKKLSDVVRSLQKKQAESPSTVYGSEKPTFLKDLNSWNSDKMRQVSSHLAQNNQPSGTPPAPLSTASAQSDLPLIEIAPNAQIANPDNIVISKAPHSAPQKSITKVTSAKFSSHRPPQNKCATVSQSAHETSMSQVVVGQNMMKTVPSQTTPESTITTSLPRGNMLSSKPIPLILQSGQEEHITVLPSLPVTVKPPATINVVSAGFSPQLTMSRVPQLHSGLTLSSVGSGSVASPKPIDPPVKSTPKQLHIAPKPSATPTPMGAANPGGQVSISVLPHGTPKPAPKPVQIAPKPPISHIHPNTQLIAPQPGHMMQAQVQTIPQPVHTVQTITQPLQTMQAIPQPIQTVQTVTGVPMQAVITQAVIDPIQLVTPSSPAKIITQPVFVTSSMQTCATYSLPPQTVSHGHLAGNVSAVTRVLTPTMVGKVAAKPQPHLMTPKPPDSLVTLNPATVGNAATVRPIVPMPQHVQPPQQILAVNVMPIGSPQVQAVTGQAGLIGKPQSTMPVSSNLLPAMPTVTLPTHATVTLSQPVVYTTTAASQIPYPMPPEVQVPVSVNAAVLSCNTGIQCEPAPATHMQASRSVTVDTGVQGTVQIAAQTNTQNIIDPALSSSSSLPIVSTSDSSSQAAVTSVCTVPVVSVSSDKAMVTSVESKVDSSISTQTCRAVDSSVRGGVPGNMKVTETKTPKNNLSVPKVTCPHNKALTSSVTITALGDPVYSSRSNVSSTHKAVSISKTSATCSGLPAKLSASVSVVPHKSGVAKNIYKFPQKSESEKLAVTTDSEVNKDKCLHNEGSDKVDTDKISTLPGGVGKTKNSTSFQASKAAVTILPSLHKNSREMSKNNPLRKQRDGADTISPLNTDSETEQDKNKPGKMLNINGKDESDNEKPNDKKPGEKKKEPILKRTLFKTKSQEEKKVGPIYRTKSLDSKKPSGAFSPLHESSVYAFEPEVETSLEESSPFSQRIRNIQPSPGTSPVKPNNVKPPPQAAVKPLPVSITPVRSPVARSLNPVISNRPKPAVSITPAPQSSQGVKRVTPNTVSLPTKVVGTSTEALLSQGKVGFVKANTSTSTTSTQPQQMKANTSTSTTSTQPQQVKANTSTSTTSTQLQQVKANTSTSTTSTQPQQVKANTATSTTSTQPQQVKANTSTSTTSTQPQQEQEKVGAEPERKDKSDTGKQSVSNASIAIQCDMDEGKETVTPEGVRANESGTQTEGPSKFPLPPNASPFYYLPLAMAALGEKLPAQLVQQMLAKTQGLVGAAEAGMILQQAAQLAQQHQQKLQQGTATPISNTSAVKPIKSGAIAGLSVAPIVSGNPSVSSVNSSRPLGKTQEPGSQSSSTLTTASTSTSVTTSTSSPVNPVVTSSSSTTKVQSPVSSLATPTSIPNSSLQTTINSPIPSTQSSNTMTSTSTQSSQNLQTTQSSVTLQTSTQSSVQVSTQSTSSQSSVNLQTSINPSTPPSTSNPLVTTSQSTVNSALYKNTSGNSTVVTSSYSTTTTNVHKSTTNVLNSTNNPLTSTANPTTTRSQTTTTSTTNPLKTTGNPYTTTSNPQKTATNPHVTSTNPLTTTTNPHTATTNTTITTTCTTTTTTTSTTTPTFHTTTTTSHTSTNPLRATSNSLTSTTTSTTSHTTKTIPYSTTANPLTSTTSLTTTTNPLMSTTSPLTPTSNSLTSSITPQASTSTSLTDHTNTETLKNNKALTVPPLRPLPTPPVASQEPGSSGSTREPPKIKTVKEKPKEEDKSEEPTRRRSGRATTLAATRATESDMQEIEELRKNRRARRVAAALAKEEGWSSSSEAPLSPQMSPDTLRGWPPSRLTSPTPSQSSEGTTSSTPSQRGNRLSSRNRKQSPAMEITITPVRHPPTQTIASIQVGQSSTPPTANIDKSMADPKAGHTCDNSLLIRAPSFFPSEEEFTDPLDYIEKIRPEAEQFGLCRIVPPSNFKPECRVNDDMRFTANNQYIHKMMKRWGPNVRTLSAIKRCLAKQNIELINNPMIGCMELDLVRLYEVVEQHGGLMEVIEKELWGKVADTCRIPRSAQERITKLDKIYCKYLLPYAMLSKSERDQLLAEVDALHNRSQGEGGQAKKTSVSSSDNDDEEEEEENLDCIVKGKSTALSTFFRIARNTSHQWQPDPTNLEVDERYWSLVVKGNHHVCVLSASIDTSEHGYGFPSLRTSPLSKHPWNLKNLCQNPNSILRSMGTIVGVTNPTLHVGMLFSTVCWYRDPHSLPWIEYLHTGASKIWYGVAASQEDKLYSALKKIAPDFVKDSAIWLPSDTAMVPPSELVREGVRVCRVVQEPGQFVVVFPGAFTSSICKGYLISESAFFARPQYFDRAVSSFKALRDCCEPSMFSLDRLALSVVSDHRATLDGLLRARELALLVVAKEKRLRAQLAEIGLEASERLSTPDSHRKKKSRFIEDEEENMCEVCRQNLYVALVTNSQEEAVYCLEHAYDFLSKNPSHLEYCKLMYTYSLSELDCAIKQMEERILLKSGKKCSPNSKKCKREHLDSFSSTSSSNL